MTRSGVMRSRAQVSKLQSKGEMKARTRKDGLWTMIVESPEQKRRVND